MSQTMSDLYRMMYSYDSFPMHIRLVANALSALLITRDMNFVEWSGVKTGKGILYRRQNCNKNG